MASMLACVDAMRIVVCCAVSAKRPCGSEAKVRAGDLGEVLPRCLSGEKAHDARVARFFNLEKCAGRRACKNMTSWAMPRPARRIASVLLVNMTDVNSSLASLGTDPRRIWE